jgi:flagellar hook assembly protein FlgD
MTTVLPVIKETVLLQNYPNPFNPETDITFYLPRQTSVTLAIYNMLGQQVAILASGQLAAGLHTVHWDGRDASGRLVSSGIYLYRLNSSEFTESRKMLLLK